MQLNRRDFGDVVVLDLLGNITLAAGGDVLLRSTVESLVAAGARKFVLNIQGVPYVDSAGLGELVRTYFVIKQKDGSLLLSHPFPRVFDLLTITKLLEVYQIVPTVIDAVAIFQSSEHWDVLFDALCPVCKPIGKRRFSMAGFFSGGECVACGATFRFIKPEQPLVEVADRSTVSLWSMSLQTYQGDEVHVSLESFTGGCTIGVPRRLDLFSIEVLEKAWFLIPEPRRIVLDVSAVEEFTDRAVARLVALGDERHGVDRSVYRTQADERHPPSPIASRLMHTGRAFDYEAWKNVDLRNWAPPVMPVTITRVVRDSARI